VLFLHPHLEGTEAEALLCALQRVLHRAVIRRRAIRVEIKRDVSDLDLAGQHPSSGSDGGGVVCLPQPCKVFQGHRNPRVHRNVDLHQVCLREKGNKRSNFIVI
jgi:hypothetical protein